MFQRGLIVKMGLAEATVDEAAVVARVDAAIARTSENGLRVYDFGANRGIIVDGNRVELISGDGGKRGYVALLDVSPETFAESYLALKNDLAQEGRKVNGGIPCPMDGVLLARWRKV